IAEDYHGDFESFFTCASSTGPARTAYFKDGVDAMKKFYHYQCILDYWRAGAVYNLFTKDPRYADGGGTREDYIAFEKAISDRE
ncbi:hypothetical protein, partial [Klebsiella pneumoniae]|uniref:hypothetical protein n=1 Tax=Klebsiella pneumoniae TaxID=573 RepID=UPI00385553F4